MTTDRPLIHIIAGPTASGKSALALERAAQMDGVIINVDSRQIYDALPILTAHPSTEDIEAAPHALYGVLHPNETCSAGLWLSMATPLIEQTLREGKTPVITGGTGLYIKTLLEGLSPIPSVPDDIRKAATALQETMGNPAFYNALKERDPETAALYHPHHTARLIRAWELLEATGKGFSYWQSLPRTLPGGGTWEFDITLVMPDRNTLYNRCNRRFDAMMDMGAVEELEAFDNDVAAGKIRPDSIMVKTLGAEPLRALRRGEISKEEALSQAKAETRHYAKRQTTWFNNQVKPQENIIVLRRVSGSQT